MLILIAEDQADSEKSILQQAAPQLSHLLKADLLQLLHLEMHHWDLHQRKARLSVTGQHILKVSPRATIFSFSKIKSIKTH